jgi:hypothetical protein
MPGQKGKSGFLAKHGDRMRKAFDAHKGDETEYSSFGDLPAGVEGVAQLVECRLTQVKEGKKNAGEWLFYAAGAVKQPAEFEGQRLFGRRTSITCPLYDTPDRQGRKTLEEHLAWVANELRKLGVDTAEMDVEELPDTLAAVKEAAPHFRFRTWKGDKQTQGKYKDQEPRVQHFWEGIVDWTEEDEAGADGQVQDNTRASSTPRAAAAVSTGGTGRGTSPKTTTSPAVTPNGAGKDSRKGKVKPAEKEEPPEEPEFGDLDSLAEAAEGGDDGAVEKLTQLALDAGVTQKQIDEADSWASVVELIGGEAEGTGHEEPEDPEPPEQTGTEEVPEEVTEEEDDTPKVEDVFSYRPVDPTTKKKAAKAIQVEVTAVNVEKKTCDVKSLSDRKKGWRGVKWDALEAPA